MEVYSDATDVFIGPRKCIHEVRAWFYPYWLLRYQLKCAPVPACAHFSGYISLK